MMFCSQVGQFLRHLVEWKRTSTQYHKLQILDEFREIDANPEIWSRGGSDYIPFLLEIGNSVFHNLKFQGGTKFKQLGSFSFLFRFIFCFEMQSIPSHVCMRMRTVKETDVLCRNREWRVNLLALNCTYRMKITNFNQKR